MKDLVSKERYCYKIHILLMKSSFYPQFHEHPPYRDYPLFLQFPNPSSLDFSKILTPLAINKRGSNYCVGYVKCSKQQHLGIM